MSKADPDEPEWGITEELLAQMIEELSILAADQRRKEPRTITRPDEYRAAPAASASSMISALAGMPGGVMPGG